MWTDQEKEQMLAKAKRDYPIGAIVKSSINNKEYRVERDNFYFESDNKIRSCICVYLNGKWAEVVSLPEPKTEQYSVF